jgi:hypothetical protein
MRNGFRSLMLLYMHFSLSREVSFRRHYVWLAVNPKRWKYKQYSIASFTRKLCVLYHRTTTIGRLP